MSMSPCLNILHMCSPLRGGGGGGPAYYSISQPASSNNIRHVSPVSIMDSEPAIMSEFSSDVDPDLEDELHQVQPLPAPVSPVSTVLSL